jgi:hypothetical protein
MQPYPLPKHLTWPILAAIFVILLVSTHLTYTWKVDRMWLGTQEFSHPIFQNDPKEILQLEAEKFSQRQFSFIFTKTQFHKILNALLDVLALLLFSTGLGYFLQSGISKRTLTSSVFVTLMPASLYQAYLITTFLASSGSITQNLADLNPWTINALFVHLPLHHPHYDLMNLLSCQLLLGMFLTLWFLRKMTPAPLLNCSLLAILPTTLLIASKILVQ